MRSTFIYKTAGDVTFLGKREMKISMNDRRRVKILKMTSSEKYLKPRRIKKKYFFNRVFPDVSFPFLSGEYKKNRKP